MPVRVYRIKNNESLIGNQSATRCQFTDSYDLATGNWQPDANSILEDFRHFKVLRKRKRQPDANMPFFCELATGYWQPDAISISDD